MQRVAILGGGAWGTSLALVATRAGRQAILWARDASTAAEIGDRRENARYLPGIEIDRSIDVTSDIAGATVADVIVLAVPAQSLRALATLAATHIAPGTPVVSAAKGLEHGTAMRMSEIVAEVMPQAIPAALSGPSFAADVARSLPTAVTVATADETLALDICHALGSPAFRPYAETDIMGVEIGGAVKNVLAIAAGIVSGRKLGASALAALTARAFAELRRLGEALGARPETLMGLSGLGDLVLTCSGPQSRNFAFGETIGSGGDSARHPLVEGIETAAVARDLARRHGVAMPIVDAVAAILDGTLAVAAAIEGLMTRPIRREAD